MPIALSETNDGRVLEARVSGQLTHEDYAQFVPRFETALRQHGKVRVLFEMADFHGWNAGGLWDEIEFDLKHFADVERFAMVGDQQWEQNLTRLSHPFTAAKVRYFDRAKIDDARAWLAGA